MRPQKNINDKTRFPHKPVQHIMTQFSYLLAFYNNIWLAEVRDIAEYNLSCFLSNPSKKELPLKQE
jgi:hypothetical protein